MKFEELPLGAQAHWGNLSCDHTLPLNDLLKDNFTAGYNFASNARQEDIAKVFGLRPGQSIKAVHPDGSAHVSTLGGQVSRVWPAAAQKDIDEATAKLKAEVDGLKAESERLKQPSWADQAIGKMGLQEIGNELGMLPGDEISSAILPAIRKLKAELTAAILAAIKGAGEEGKG